MGTQGKLAQKLNWRNEPEARIIDSTGRLVAELDGYGPGAKAEAADARRLVACWNAFDGMPIELIDSMPGPVSEMALHALAVTEQCDQLLAALEHLVAVTTPDINGQIGSQEEHAVALYNAHVAITVVKAGAA